MFLRPLLIALSLFVSFAPSLGWTAAPVSQGFRCLVSKLTALIAEDGPDLPSRRGERKAIRSDEAQKLFDQMRDEWGIPYEFGNEGCFARAHVAAYRLEKLKIRNRKVFAQVGKDYSLEGRSRLFPKVIFDWFFHVANLVDVRAPNGEVVPMVFDPAMFDQPVPISIWLQAMTSRPLPKLELSEVNEKATGYFIADRFTYNPSTVHTLTMDWAQHMADAQAELEHGWGIIRSVKKYQKPPGEQK